MITPRLHASTALVYGLFEHLVFKICGGIYIRVPQKVLRVVLSWASLDNPKSVISFHKLSKLQLSCPVAQ